MAEIVNDIVEQTRETLESECGVLAGARLIVAVSGGADSVCLLDVLRRLGYRCTVAHVHHGLRGAPADADEAFVKELAARMDVPCRVTRLDLRKSAGESSESVEMAARRARYGVLADEARAVDASAIATAHHADDQAETVLMRVLRGTSPKGLAGIPVRGEWDGVAVVRPMLPISREDILAYVTVRHLPYREDESNIDRNIQRNRIRLDLFPQLAREYNQNVRDALCRLAAIESVENDYLVAQARQFAESCTNPDGTLDRGRFAEGHPVLQARFIEELAKSHRATLDFDHIQAAIQFIESGKTGAQLDLGGGVSLINGAQSVALIPAEPDSGNHRAIALPHDGAVAAFGRRVSVRPLESLPETPLAKYCTASRQVFDAEALQGDLEIRHPREGDRFRPMGLGGSKKLGDYFTDRGTPRWERKRQLVVTVDGEIVWVIGHALAERAAITPDSTKFIEIDLSDEAE